MRHRWKQSNIGENDEGGANDHKNRERMNIDMRKNHKHKKTAKPTNTQTHNCDTFIASGVLLQ